METYQRVSDQVVTPQYEDAVQYAIDRLEKELPIELCYHDIRHTVDEVMPAAMKLAQIYDVSQGDRELLRVAAAFHDTGFIFNPVGHEVISARIAAQKLPDFGFGNRQIEQVMGIILSTRIPQSPNGLLEEIMADADLDILGREDFFEFNELLRCERLILGNWQSPCEWYEEQVNFLEKHRYFTGAARRLRDPVKNQNLAQLHKLLEECLQ